MKYGGAFGTVAVSFVAVRNDRVSVLRKSRNQRAERNDAMICPSCGSTNADDVLTCVTCGEELSHNSEKVTGRVCPGCRFVSDADARYCMKCGAALSNRSKPRAQRQSPQVHESRRKSRHLTNRRKAWYESPTTIIIISVAVVVVFVLYGTRRHRSVASVATATPGVILDPAMKPAFDKVVDRFICGCGECTEPLWECNCPTAENEKNMIKNHLESGEKSPKIIDAVYKTYGHLARGSGSKEVSATGTKFNPGVLSLSK